MEGRPDSDETAAAPAGAGPSTDENGPMGKRGWLDREDENERISLDIFGLRSDNKVGDFTRYLWI